MRQDTGAAGAYSLQYQHLANLVVFVLVGKLRFHMGVTWAEIAGALACGLAAEYLGRRVARDERPPSPVTASISSLAVCMILRADASWVLPAAAFAGVASKAVLRWRGRHFQNPSNVGVLLALLAWPDQTSLQRSEWAVNPEGWGLVAIAGVLLVVRAGLVYETAVSAGTLAFAHWLVVSRNPASVALRLLNVSTLLYLFFLQNDPRVLPPSRRGRTAFLATSAVLTVGLGAVFGPRDSNLPAALFLASLTVPLWRTSPADAGPWPLRRRMAAAFPVAALAALYASPWNRPRNVVRSVSSAVAPPAQPDARPAASAPAEASSIVEVRSRTDAATYRRPAVGPGWIQAPLPPPAVRAPLHFSPRPILPPYPAGHPDRYATWLFAGIAVGDLDHDGHLDAILYGEGRRLAAWLWREGRFVDATAAVMPDAPDDVDQAALADFDGDGWLDLLLVLSQANGERPSGLWLWSPATSRFAPMPAGPAVGRGKRSGGGVAVDDVNHDGVLDFYLSFGVDWGDGRPDAIDRASEHELWVSSPSGWREERRRRFPERVRDLSLVGMTARFSRQSNPTSPDLLLGDDYDDPSLFLFGSSRGAFHLPPPGTIEANTVHSMSFFPVDLDGDGTDEFVEIGLAPPNGPTMRPDISFDEKAAPARTLDAELIDLARRSMRDDYDCSRFSAPLARYLCDAAIVTLRASRQGRLEVCRAQANPYLRSECEATVRSLALDSMKRPDRSRYDVEVFAKQMDENVFLRRDPATGRYRLFRQLESVELTGWSWAAYPEDLDGDGDVDLAISNGFLGRSVHPNRLLLNASTPGRILLREATLGSGLAFGDQSRGLVAADFDEDGDADLLVANLAGEPQYLENESGGDRIEVELRGAANTFGLGARVELFDGSRRQVREMAVGGVWNVSQPPRLRFAVVDDGRPRSVRVAWPDGRSTLVDGAKVNHRIVVWSD